MATKAYVRNVIINFFDTYDPEDDFSLDDMSDREHITDALLEHLEDHNVLNLTDSADVDDESDGDSDD